MSEIVNIAAYQFVTLEDLPSLRSELRQLCLKLQLRGSILLSEEGINLFIAGARGSIDKFVVHLHGTPEFKELPIKESLSDEQPFTRMLVRIKKEIIAFGVDEVDPRKYTSRRLPAKQLKQWLDEGKPITLLDTRNDYEVKVGTFENALPIHVDEFRDFPEAVSKLPEDLKKQPIVTFCTGGIRCEKAAPYMETAGFQDVYQLDGGILKYFEECGGAHYQGDCFVFDHRVAVDPDLKETDARMCYVCQAPLTPEECRSEQYDPRVSCPYCHHLIAQRQSALIDERNKSIAKAASPLPGSVPYENYRPITVQAAFDGMSVIDFLVAKKTVLSREDWLGLISQKRILLRGEPVTEDHILKAGQRLQSFDPAHTEPDVRADINVLHEDDAIVVINKPGCLPMHPCGRFNRNTLEYLLRQAFQPLKIRPAHRLDANTSGLVVCSKTRKVASLLQPQFEQGRVKKTYLCRVHGHPDSDTFESTAGISKEPTEAGARTLSPDGLSAETHFSVLSRLEDGTSLVEARPMTGRTNQIRIHLWGLGFPIVGDPLYLPEGKMGARSTLTPSDPPMCLHALKLMIEHPETGEPKELESPLPHWAQC